LFAFAWVIAASFYPRQAMWAALIWVPVQGWFQINMFGNSAQTVLLYEFQIIPIYIGLLARALRYPKTYGPPAALGLALPFAIWLVVLIPHSIEYAGAVLTAVGLRTYLFPIPLVWVGYRAFKTKRELEAVAALLSAELALVGTIAALQFMNLVTPWGSVIDVPTGFVSAGILRPPGTFSSPGHLGMYVLAMVPLGVGFMSLNAGRWQNLSYRVGMAGAAVALVVNSQRATIVILLACLPVLALFTRHGRKVKVIALVVGFATVGILAGLFVVGSAFAERVYSIAEDVDYTLWIAPVERMTDALKNPLIGVGLGTASPGISRLDFGEINPAESFGAALVFQAGIPGLILFVLLIAALLKAGYNALSRSRGQGLELLAAAILAYEVAICLDSWSYDPLHYPPSRVFFWFWAGVLLSLPRLSDSRAIPASAASMFRAPDKMPNKPHGLRRTTPIRLIDTAP
jgi:hypothetical protein